MRVLIASLPFGTGHDSAALAIAQALLSRGAQVHRSRDLEAHVGLTRTAYNQALRLLPMPFDALFHESHDGWAGAWNVNRRRWRKLAPALQQVAAGFRPDWVVATHPFALAAWAGVEDRTFGLAGVVTDLSVHRFWMEPDADGYAVWLPGMRQDLVRWGYPAERVWVTGIPIRPEFGQVHPRFDGPLVVMGGGLGMGPIEATVDKLRALDRPIRVVCGRNEHLFDKLRRRFATDRVEVFGYVQNMPQVLDGAALVVSKPGGLTVAETAASGVPLLISHHLPGQECINRDRLRRMGVAVVGSADVASVARAVLRRERWDEQAHRQRHLGRADAAQALAAELFLRADAVQGQAAPLP